MAGPERYETLGCEVVNLVNYLHSDHAATPAQHTKNAARSTLSNTAMISIRTLWLMEDALEKDVGDAIIGGLIDHLDELAKACDGSDRETIYRYILEFHAVSQIITQEFDRQAGITP